MDSTISVANVYAEGYPFCEELHPLALLFRLIEKLYEGEEFGSCELTLFASSAELKRAISVQVPREECSMALVILVEWLGQCASRWSRSKINSLSECSRGFMWDIEQAVRMAASLKRHVGEEEYLRFMRASIGGPLYRLRTATFDSRLAMET